MITGAPVNALDFGADPTGVTDSTTAIQAALDYCVGLYKLILPAGTYLVTNTLNLYKGSQIEGINNYQGSDSYSVGAIGTRIIFTPTSLKDLFVIQNLPLPLNTFRSKVSIQGIRIIGDGGVNTRSALYMTDSIYNNFENLYISSFQYGIYMDGTPINNRFVNNIISGVSTECVHYETAGTTDVWDQCTFNNAPRGVVLKGGSIAFRFLNCLWEQLDISGMDIDKGCRSIQVTNGYCEDVPCTVAADTAMFRVGFSGTTSSLSTTLQVIGGNFAGRNAGTTGTMCDVDDSVGVQLMGVYAARFTNLIKTSANTSAYAVACSGVQFNSCTNTLAGTGRFSGTLDIQAVNAGTGPYGIFNSVTANTVTANSYANYSGVTWAANAGAPEGVFSAVPGSLYSRTDGGAGTSLYVKESGTGNTGWVAK
jgi:hypothetical protein